MADCKRKTANLFDKSNGSYNAYVDDAGTWRYVDTAKSVKIPCLANTTYTLSVPENLSVFRIYEISDALAEPPTRAAEIIRSGGIDRYIFTTASTTAAIIFQGSAGNFDEWFNGLMLNTGSTALPYEPYWQHSLRKLGTATDTLTTLPVDLYADGNSATVGLQGNMTQTGIPTPENPITPQETGDRTENLFDYKTVYNSYIDNNGNIATTANNLTQWNYFTADEIGKTFTISLYVDSISASYIRVQGQINESYITGNAINAGSTGFTEITVTPTSTSDRWRITYGTGTPNVVLNQVMVAVSSTRKEYELYGYKIPISSGDTTTPVYLGEVQSTRRIRKYELTGNETPTTAASITNTNAYQFRNEITEYEREAFICSHMPVNNSSSGSGTHGYIGTYLTLCFDKAMGLDTTEKVKTYLATQYANSTPVTVWYVLTTPTTGIVNEPLRKIGNYADSITDITIPTLSTADTFDVGTTLKPSKVELTYTGWHDVEVKEKSGNLFDKDSTTIYNAYIGTDGTWRLSDDSRSIKIPVSGNTQYTLSIDSENNAVFRIYETNNSSVVPVSSSSVVLRQIVRDTTIKEYTFTTLGDTQMIVFQGGSSAITEWFNSLMLNTGSTALPYEPYWK